MFKNRIVTRSVLAVCLIFVAGPAKAQLSEDGIKSMCAAYGEESPETVEARLLNGTRSKYDKVLDDLRSNPEAQQSIATIKRAFGCPPPIKPAVYDRDGNVLEEAVHARGCSIEARREAHRQMEQAVAKLDRLLPKSKNKSDTISLHYNAANQKVQFTLDERAKYFDQTVRLQYRKDFLSNEVIGGDVEMTRLDGQSVSKMEIPHECRVSAQGSNGSKGQTAISRKVAQ